MGVLIDHTGQRFGRLLVQKRAPRPNKKRAYWQCLCDCGQSTTVAHDTLVSGTTKSCGCLRRENSRRLARVLIDEGRMPVPRQYANTRTGPCNHAIGVYISNADRRGILWDLTYSDCEQLFTASCVYCGAPPASQGRRGFFYNGIDRVDNSKGYVRDNVVSCCAVCNRAKLTMAHQDFVAWIARAAKHLLENPFTW